MEPLTKDDFTWLMSVPPYQCDHEDLVLQYFGNVESVDVANFIKDLTALEKNYAILKKRKTEEKEQSTDLLDFVNRKSQILEKCVKDLITRLEIEYEKRETEKYVAKRGRGSEAEEDVSLSTILGAIHTLKIDVKILINFLRCNVEVNMSKEKEKKNVT